MRKITTLKGLKRAVKELVGSEYHTVLQTIKEYHTGEVVVEYNVYTSEYGWTAGYKTPTDVFIALREGLKNDNQ